MAYSVLADVQSEFKDIEFTATTKITSTEITDPFILQADAEINARIGLRYVVPITGTESLKIMKMLSVWITADRISKILRIKTKTEEDTTAEKSLRQMANELIDKIVAGTFLLSDATLKSSANGFKSYANDNDLDYTFHKNTDEW